MNPTSTIFILLSTLAVLHPACIQARVDIPFVFLGGHPGAQSYTSIGSLLSKIIPNAIVFAGVFFFLLIIYGGFQLIVYGGQNNSPQRVAQSKSMVTYGFIGFLLVVSAYFILQLIGAVTGVNFINSPIT